MKNVRLSNPAKQLKIARALAIGTTTPHTIYFISFIVLGFTSRWEFSPIILVHLFGVAAGILMAVSTRAPERKTKLLAVSWALYAIYAAPFFLQRISVWPGLIANFVFAVLPFALGFTIMKSRKGRIAAYCASCVFHLFLFPYILMPLIFKPFSFATSMLHFVQPTVLLPIIINILFCTAGLFIVLALNPVEPERK
jgi:hypothetical protein